MTRKFKVKQIKEAEYENATLSLKLYLPMGPAGTISTLDLSYTCPQCAGHGCRHGSGPCDNQQTIDIKNIKQSIGEEQAQYLIEYLEIMILKIKNGN